jgi:hypothetical protein
VRKEKKISNKNTKCNRVPLKNAYVSETLNFQQLRLSRNTKKNSFTLVELGSYIQKWVVKSIGNKSDNTLKKVSDNTLKNKKWVTTHSRKVSTTTQERWALQLKKGEYNSSKQFTSRSRKIKLEKWREVRLSLNKNLTNWMFLSLRLSISLCIWRVSPLE